MAGEKEQGRVVSDEERARAILQQLKSVHALDIGRDMVIAAVNFSSPKLGLSDETRAVRDLDDVRLSIELIRAILEVLDRDHGATTGDLHDTLAQLQLAYAHAVQLAAAERAAEHPTEAAAPGSAAAGGEAADAAAAGAHEEAEAAGGGAEGRTEKPAATPEEAPPAKEPAPQKKRAAARKPAAKNQTAAKKRAAASKKPAPKKKPDAES